MPIQFNGEEDFNAKAMKYPLFEYQCERCLETFQNSSFVKSHAKSCLVQFTKIIYDKDGLSIAAVIPESPPIEKAVCERISYMEKQANRWDFSLLRDNNWLTIDRSNGTTFRSQAFLLLKESSVVAYVLIRRQYFQEPNGRYKRLVIVANLFTIPEHRHKGYMRLLLPQSLRYLNRSFRSAVFLTPFTRDGYECISKISKSLGYNSINTWPH